MNTCHYLLVFSTLLVSVLTINAQCISLYGQCGGKDYTGPRCCAPPRRNSRYVSFIPPGSVECRKVSEYYSQCVPKCSREKPCLIGGRTCAASANGASDGRGRQYCGPRGQCTNPEWCFTTSFCVCGGSKPCRLPGRAAGCEAPNPKPSCPTCGVCRASRVRCPAFEGEQCGGKFHKEPTTCQPGLKCVRKNLYFSICLKP